MRSLTLVPVLLAAMTATAQTTGLTSLERLRDRARPLLIFAPKPDDPRLEIQLRTLDQHAPETHDRDLVPLALPYNAPQPSAAQLSPDEALMVRRRFHVAPGDFAVILLGKDGGAKLRSDQPLTMQKLNSTVDVMPMRREEMQQSPR